MTLGTIGFLGAVIGWCALKAAPILDRMEDRVNDLFEWGERPAPVNEGAERKGDGARDGVCEHCGAKMVEYRHTFNQALATGLGKLHKAGAPVNLKTLGLDRNQWDNFQKLRYWGLVEKAKREDGTRMAGTWRVTDKGRQFVNGETSIQRSVWTYRGEAVRFEGETVHFADFEGAADDYKTQPEYADEAVPHEEAMA